ncbi:MAG: winged helix-turn-helix domain-containing protein [Candidatus Methanoperedens sp.]|nr:winged helix-turn-helix domain-containing protein [Candidatus Methanoperedens sp.]MCZ7361536.1 winged helix-turn-helix domain-containing protein [Candidatus Methanoperedens sp.]HLB71500.1 winged helix-turn-helix domain-containing protein [Candidatus Methanoperedens sp.]
MSIDQTIISILTNENSKKILLSLIESEKSANELSSTLNIPLSTTYRILSYLENEGLIKINKMVLSSEGHHLKIYRAKFNKIILTIDAENIKVHFMLDESEKLRDIWKKLSETI